MERKIENYILEHSSVEDPILKELYRQTYIRYVNPNMTSGHIQGRFLEMISKMIRPTYILEIGTFTGYSAICMAKGLKPGGKLITLEINDELNAFSEGFFSRTGLDDKIELINGRAQDLIPGLDYEFDLVFIDGDKREYCEYFRLIKDKVKIGGILIADNVLWGGKVLDEYTKDPQTRGIIEFNNMISKEPGIENIILPLRDGIMLMRII